ncbi:MAG TPA: hypothetical protein VF495_06975 [Phenylobacterium sp.]
MTADAIERDRFDIARVIQQTFGVLGRNIATFSILGVVLCGIPTAIVAFVAAGMTKGLLDGAQTQTFTFSPAMSAIGGMSWLATLITTAILQGALIHATVQDLNGQPQSVGDSLATGLRNFLPLICVTILFAIAFVFGLVLLVVPGVMIACAWCVAAPSLVADRTGIIGAFSRSAELTRGNRWQIFGLLVIVFVVEWLISIIFNAITGTSSIGMSGNPLEAAKHALSPLVLALGVIRQTVGAVIGATAAAVIYVELRRAREGEPTGWLAEIFR